MDLAGQHGRGLIFPGTGFSARCAVPVVFRGGHQKWCPPLIFSVLKARNRNDADTVTAFVRKWCHAAENHKERRLFHSGDYLRLAPVVFLSGRISTIHLVSEGV